MITRTIDVTVARRRGPYGRLAVLLPIALLVVLLGACSSAPPVPGQNQPPIASFSASPLQGIAPLTVTFDASASVDPDGTIIAHAWQFGDGETASGVAVQHTYAQPGTYTARLTVTDDAGATGSAQRTITVTGADGNAPPTASFTATPDTGSAPLTVTFDASASIDTDGTITAYAWQFGDGETASGVAVQHTYAQPGTYTARLTVTDDAGATGSAQRTITVTGADGNAPPTASFTATPDTGSAPLTVTFDASASVDPDGTLVSYVWDFGDGGAGTGSTTTHTYVAAGTYVARLTVTDDGGASASATATITVTGGDTGVGEQVRTMETGFVTTEAVFSEPHRLIAASVNAALEATRQNGGVGTLTGTLTETTPDAFTYSPAPNDRLRLELLGGRTVDITFATTPQGDFDGDGLRFLSSPHVIDLRVTSNAAAGSLDVRVASSPGTNTGTQVGSFSGSFVDGAEHGWTVDVGYESFRRSEVAFEYNELESILYMKGTLGSTSRGIAIDLERRNRYKLVNTVEQNDEQMDHTIVWGGDTYRLAGRVSISRRDSKPVDRDQWVIDGALTRNGTLIGQYQASEDVSGLTVRLQVGAEGFRLFFFGYI